LLALLRIAVILERSHGDDESPVLTASSADDRLELLLPEGWLVQHPLSLRELEVEAAQLASAGIELHY
jgi:exopolyphosphatase/guanosine-5'-triphosphate,3'-diphosphate pyrophosphatase